MLRVHMYALMLIGKQIEKIEWKSTYCNKLKECMATGFSLYNKYVFTLRYQRWYFIKSFFFVCYLLFVNWIFNMKSFRKIN